MMIVKGAFNKLLRNSIERAFKKEYTRMAKIPKRVNILKPLPKLERSSTLDPWIHRSKGMSCSTCMWFVEKPAHTPEGVGRPVVLGRCRRHAPTMSGYPVVFLTDWCGDHKLDENKI